MHTPQELDYSSVCGGSTYFQSFNRNGNNEEKDKSSEDDSNKQAVRRKTENINELVSYLMCHASAKNQKSPLSKQETPSAIAIGTRPSTELITGYFHQKNKNVNRQERSFINCPSNGVHLPESETDSFCDALDTILPTSNSKHVGPLNNDNLFYKRSQCSVSNRTELNHVPFLEENLCYNCFDRNSTPKGCSLPCITRKNTKYLNKPEVCSKEICPETSPDIRVVLD